jgi:hypothetical protein
MAKSCYNWIIMDGSRQIISIFLDDSGIFTKNPTDPYFIYAGYVFLGYSDQSGAKRQYRSLSNSIRTSLNHSGELKAWNLRDAKHKRALVNVLKGYESMACVVFLPSIRRSIIEDRLSIHRYKDYALKISIKRKLETLINSGKLDASKPTDLKIYIDEQHTSTNGFYNLRETIREEFVNGIRNLDYGSFHPPLFTNDMTITVQYCDSSANYLIQASDLLANRLNRSFNHNKPKLRQLPKLHIVSLP